MDISVFDDIMDFTEFDDDAKGNNYICYFLIFNLLTI